jgi:hypothetical protein
MANRTSMRLTASAAIGALVSRAGAGRALRLIRRALFGEEPAVASRYFRLLCHGRLLCVRVVVDRLAALVDFGHTSP